MPVEDKKMTEQSKQVPETSENSNQWFVVILILAVVLFWGIRHPSSALRVMAVLLGFGGIVMIHEFGHFIVAKLGKIKVEVFSIGMGPVIFGIRKLKKGWRFRVLPKMGEEQHVEEGDNETEYQIGLLPIGGYVKMLGQSDTGAAEAIDDPRSYANRPVWIRICVVSAGVIFNAISAAILFMVLYMNGIDLPAGVVGGVVKNSPAYEAGIRPGDKIITVNGNYFEIDGSRCVDFETVFQASLLSVPDKPTELVVSRDGIEKQISIISEKRAGDPSGLRFAGFEKAESLQVSRYLTRSKDPNTLDKTYDNFQLCRGDVIKTVDGEAVRSYWDFQERLSKTFRSEIELGISRLVSETEAAQSRKWSDKIDPENDPRTQVTVSYPMTIPVVVENFRDEFDLTHFGSLVPRLKVAQISEPTRMARIINWVRMTLLRKDKMASVADILQKDDIIVKIDDVDYPNYQQLRELTDKYKDKSLPVVVLRKNKEGVMERLELAVTPKADPNTGRVIIGFSAALDLENTVVAQTLPVEGLQGDLNEIPSGAVINAVGGQPVATYFDIARIMQSNAGKEVKIDYTADGKPGSASFAVSEHDPVHAEAFIAYILPLDELTMNYKASNPFQAMGLGFKKVSHFVVGNLMTLKRLFQREVPMSALSGPVGIISMTYQVTGVSLDHTLYFLGLISSCLAVMNLLPLPVLDGGHIVLLLIEKISGKPVHEKVLVPIMYVGLALLMGLIVWISIRDVIKLLFVS